MKGLERGEIFWSRNILSFKNSCTDKMDSWQGQWANGNNMQDKQSRWPSFINNPLGISPVISPCIPEIVIRTFPLRITQLPGMVGCKSSLKWSFFRNVSCPRVDGTYVLKERDELDDSYEIQVRINLVDSSSSLFLWPKDVWEALRDKVTSNIMCGTHKQSLRHYSFLFVGTASSRGEAKVGRVGN